MFENPCVCIKETLAIAVSRMVLVQSVSCITTNMYGKSRKLKEKYHARKWNREFDYCNAFFLSTVGLKGPLNVLFKTVVNYTFKMFMSGECGDIECVLRVR